MTETRTRTARKRFSVDALFTDTSARGVGVDVLAEARLIRLERIEPDPNQPRRTIDADRLDELAASIRAEGVLQPIAVRYDDARDVYVVVHGERRWRAASLAGLTAIPAIVREVPEERRLLQQLMENVVREDLNALDRAAALRALKEQMGNASWDRVAEAVGIRRSRLFQLLDTERLEATIQDALRRGLVSEKQTRALHRLFPELQAEIGERVLAGELSGRDLPDAARAALAGVAAAPDAGPGRVSSTGSARTVIRQANALTRSLEAFDAATLDSTARESLASELRALRVRIDDTLAGLDDPA